MYARLSRLLLPALFAVSLCSAADRGLEYAVKATYLYKFAPFVDWPAGTFDKPDAPFVICLIGDDPFNGQVQQAVQGQFMGTHPIEVRHLPQFDGRTKCQIMFIAFAAPQSVDEALEKVRGTPVLTVTDAANAGAVVRFVIDHDRVRFDIDNDAAAKNGLSINSKLLDLARVVKPAEEKK